TSMDVTWKTYGDRADVDTTTQAKETLLNYFLDLYKGWKPGDPLPQFEGLDIYYLGGTRYDFVEIFLKNDTDGKKFFLRVRASGTEPITRVYVESANQAIAEKLINVVLKRLDEINADLIQQAYSIEHLADLLSNTRFADSILAVTRALLNQKNWDAALLCTLLTQRRPHVESRNAKLIDQWLAAIGSS